MNMLHMENGCVPGDKSLSSTALESGLDGTCLGRMDSGISVMSSFCGCGSMGSALMGTTWLHSVEVLR